LLGDAARNGRQSHPVTKNPAMYGNLKLFFKNDLLKTKGELGHSYFYEKTLHFGETSPQEVTKDFLRLVLANLDSAETLVSPNTRVYFGKPAYPAKIEERYSKSIRQIFKELGFGSHPNLVYEPYALFYYCRYGLGKDFSRGDGRSSNILVIDHGGGTINSCVIQSLSSGKLKRARPKAPHASQHGGGMIDQHLLIRALERQKLSTETLLQIFTERSDLRLVEKEHLLLQMEHLKISLFTEGANTPESIEGCVEEHTIPEVPKPWKFTFTRKDVKEGFLKVWSGCHATIATTLRTSGIEKIDYVLLAGGSCRLGFHKDLIIRDFSEFFNPQTEFVDISSHDKPVAYGLAIQALLDSYAHGEVIEAAEDEVDENLSDFVARDLKIAIGTDSEETVKPYDLAEEIILSAGTSKAEVWEKGVDRQVNLRSKPKRLFRYAFFSESPTLLKENQPQELSQEITEGEDIQIKRSRLNDLERRIRITLQVNSDGRVSPHFYLTPTKAPKYCEPDRGSYHLYVPDLEARRATVQAPRSAEPQSPILAIDFGTSSTCVCGIDISAGQTLLRSAKALVPEPPVIGYLGHQTKTTLADELRNLQTLFGDLEFHPTIGSSASKLFRDGHYSQAVFDSLKAVETAIKEAAGYPTDPKGKELYGRPLVMKAFDVDSPLIRVSDDSNLQLAFRDLASSLLGIRNNFAHEGAHELRPSQAIKWLGTASVLLKAIDERH
jgi:molecular chaperone DnaK (HSP70)